MPVVYNCPHCGQPINVPDHMLGQTIGCPQCKKPFQTLPPPPAVPAPAPLPPVPPPVQSAFDFGNSSAEESDEDDYPGKRSRGRRTPGIKRVEQLAPMWQRVHFGVWLTRLAPVLSIIALVLAVIILAADIVVRQRESPSELAQFFALAVVAVPMLIDIAGRGMSTAVKDPKGQLLAWLATGAAGAFLLAWIFGVLRDQRSRDALDQMLVPLMELVMCCLAMGFWLRFLYWLGWELDSPRLSSDVISFCWALGIGFIFLVGCIIGGVVAAVQSRNIWLVFVGLLPAGCIDLYLFVRYIQLLSAALNTIRLRAPTREEEAAEEAADDDDDEVPLELD